jgi:hypothetical protein
MLKIRKIVTLVEETHVEAGITAEKPLRKVAIAVVVNNPYAGRYSEDLSEIIDPSEELGRLIGQRVVAAMAGPVESYGKSCIVGWQGEQEHANAYLTASFANPIRDAIGGGKAWISSSTKRGALGVSIDVPLANKDALYVRSHYDTITVCVPDAPEPDEAVVIIGAANHGRLNFRLGGLRYEDIEGKDGLR